MKVLAKILLVTITVPVLMLLILSANIKFQLLTSSFWIDVFIDGNVYEKISNDLSSRLELRTVEEGGRASDVEDLSSLVSENNVKIFFEENIKSVILYANGKSPEIILTFPFSNNLWNLSQKMTLSDFLEENNIEIINTGDIQKISKTGAISFVALLVFVSLFVSINILMYLLTDYGGHLSYNGMAFVLNGVIFSSLFFVGKFIVRILTSDYLGNPNVAKSMAAIVVIPVVNEMVAIWLLIGTSLLVGGIVLFFIKKPVNNQK